jgi:hypothetical protein
MNTTDLNDLQSVLKAEVNNFQATHQMFPDEVKYTNKLLSLYQVFNRSLSTYPRAQIPVLQMLWMCFRGFLTSTKLLFETHIPEAYAIISRSAEAVGAARKMSRHPDKIPEWVEREKETSQPFRRILGELFPKGDKVVFSQIFDIYVLTTEHGRHPNFTSTIFFSDFGRMNTENMVDFNYFDFDKDNPITLRRCLNYQIYAYLKFLSAFREIFKKYLTKEWVKDFELFESDYGVYKETLRDVFDMDK